MISHPATLLSVAPRGWGSIRSSPIVNAHGPKLIATHDPCTYMYRLLPHQCDTRNFYDL